MSRNIIDSIASGENLEAEAHFSNSMVDKVGKALEIKRQELAGAFVNRGTKNEED